MRKHIVVAILAIGSFATSAVAGDDPFERRLYTDRVEASSFDWNDWNRFQENYHPNYVGDDDPKTAWTEGAKGTGAGEWIRVHHTELDGVTQTRLKIRNGYQKSPSLFTRNARANQLTIKLLPNGPESKIALKDESGWQEVVVKRPAGKQTGYEIRVDSVYPGTHYEDLCISDIQTFVTATTGDNPTFEKSKLKDLLAWKKQRVDAANAFKNTAGKSFPIGAQYKLENKGEQLDGGPCNYDDPCLTRSALRRAQKEWPDRKAQLAALEADLEKSFESWQPVTVSTLDPRKIPVAEGFRMAHAADESWPWEDAVDLPLPGQVGFFTATQLRRVYQPAAVSPKSYLDAEAPECKKGKSKFKNFYWSQKQPGKNEAAPLHSILVVSCGMAEGREGHYPASHWQVLVYNHDGQLDAIVSMGQITALKWGTGKKGPLVASAQRLTSLGVPNTTLALAETQTAQ